MYMYENQHGSSRPDAETDEKLSKFVHACANDVVKK
jgi:hypothetical protein